jgi:hypothetical protein
MKIKLAKYKPATESEISDVEHRLGFTLPNDYRYVLKTFNGAIPEDNVFGEDLTVSVERFIPVASIATRAESVDGFPQDAVPIAEAASGNFVYMRKELVDIFYWDHEIETDRRLASSFNQFLETLRPFDIDSVKLKPGQVKSVWVAPGFKPDFD